ncbi:MAG: BlaI/MecI/CopY family transcriptional regulator [Chthoniobacterales bacterium]
MKAKKSALELLPPRERQIMDIIYAAGEADSQEVQEKLANAPGYSAVRATMQKLVRKGMLTCRRKGLKYVFVPVVSTESARESALSRLIGSFFNNSPIAVVSSLLNSAELNISSEELKELKSLITQKEKKNKK